MLDKKLAALTGYYHVAHPKWRACLIGLSLLFCRWFSSPIYSQWAPTCISSSIANDLYYRTLNPKHQKNQLLVGRATIAVTVVIAGYFGLNPPGFVGQVVAFAFGLASASFFLQSY